MNITTLLGVGIGVAFRGSGCVSFKEHAYTPDNVLVGTLQPPRADAKGLILNQAG